MALRKTNFLALTALEEAESGVAQEIVRPFWIQMDLQHRLVVGLTIEIPGTWISSVIPEKYIL
jgi:hypothetical protein